MADGQIGLQMVKSPNMPSDYHSPDFFDSPGIADRRSNKTGEKEGQNR
jgi:hypothetical protein